MTSLYKSTDPFVRALLRDVEGQVRSYRADHPESGLTDRAARGIAKRVTGQIVSSWARLSDVRATAIVRASEAAGGYPCSHQQAVGVPTTSAPTATPIGHPTSERREATRDG